MRNRFRSIEEQALQKRIYTRLENIERLIAAGLSPEAIPAIERLTADLSAWNQAEWERKHNAILSGIAISLSQAINLDEILSQIIDGLAKILPFDAAGVFIVESDGNIAAEYLRGYRRDSYQKVHQKVGEGVVGRTIRFGKTSIVNDVSKDPDYISARSGTRSELAVPMFSQVTGEPIGVFNLESNTVNAYSEDDADLVMTLAANAAVAIERAQMYQSLLHQQRINEELALARRIQQSLLPANTTTSGLELKGFSIPTEQVGGDYYDFFQLTKKDVAVTIADVAGKGIPAALIMAGLRGSLRVEARNTYSIGQIFSEVNNFLHSTSQPGEYVTLLYGVIDTTSKSLTYSNAGHNPAILYRKNGEVEMLGIGSVPLGAFDFGKWPETTVKFNRGDLLILYTDGVTEAESKTGEMFGIKRLMDSVNAHAKFGSSIFLEKLKQAVADHIEGAASSDDMTVLTAQFAEVS